MGPDVVAVVSHATQEYLRELVEKISAVAKHRRASPQVHIYFNCFFFPAQLL